MDDQAPSVFHQDGRGVRGLKSPLYHRIYLILRQQILDGAYADGALLPGEQELVTRFGVSRITARRALDELAADGLAERAQGRGTFARAPRPVPPVKAQVEGLLENLLMMGLRTTARVVAFEERPATEEVARHLGLSPGAAVQRAVRVRSLDDGPISHLTTWVPGEIGRTYTRDDLVRQPLLSLLERAGVAVESADQTISACLADAEVASLIGAEIGAPLTRISRIVRDRDGRAVEWLIALYRPDRYQYRMRLALNRGGGRTLWEPARDTTPTTPDDNKTSRE